MWSGGSGGTTFAMLSFGTLDLLQLFCILEGYKTLTSSTERMTHAVRHCIKEGSLLFLSIAGPTVHEV